MNIQEIGNCSRCGKQSNIIERWVACVSSSCWQSKDNYPTPAMPSWVDDDIKVWRIPLCLTCQVKGYIDFLSDRIRRSLKFLKWSPVMFIGSVLGFAVLRLFMYLTGAYKMEDIGQGHPLGGVTYFVFAVAGMILVVLLLVSIFGAPFHFLRYLSDSKRVRAIRISRSIPPSKVNDAFKGEAQRIIDALEQGKQGEVTGTFDLPKYKKRAEHKKWKNEPEGQFNRTNQSRSIALVAGTRPELEKQLSSEWKTLLQS